LSWNAFIVRDYAREFPDVWQEWRHVIVPYLPGDSDENVVESTGGPKEPSAFRWFRLQQCLAVKDEIKSHASDSQFQHYRTH
jgi:hypothetical protein